MEKQEPSTHISNNSSNFNNKYLSEKHSNFKQSHRSKLTLYKNLNTSKASIENELINSKKITDIPSKYKDEEITFENSFYIQLEPDIVCYNMETHYDGQLKSSDNKKINKPKSKPKPNPNNPQQPDHSYNKNTDKDYDKDYDKDRSTNSINRTKISKTRLLHSRLRPDTSNTSVIELPNIKYTLSTEKLPKLKYPKNVPPPAFKQVGSYKCKIPTMTSKERLLERQRLKKEQKEIQKIKEKESMLSIDPTQQSKFLKRKENTQYDIIFGKEELEEYMRENIDDEPIESRHRMKSAAKKLFKRFQKIPKSESEIIIIDEEQVDEQPTRTPSPIMLPSDDSSEEIEIGDSEEELESESEEEPEELQIEEHFEDEPEVEIIEVIPKKKSSKKLQKKDSPIRKISSKEIIPTPKKSSSEEIILKAQESSSSSEKIIPVVVPIKKHPIKELPIKEHPIKEHPIKEHPIKAIERKESSVKVIHTEKKPISPEVDECMEQCKYKPLCTAMKTGLKPGIKKPLVIFKECDRQMCIDDKEHIGHERDNLMRNISIQCENKPRSVEVIVSDARALPAKSRSSRGSSNYNGMEMNGAAVQHSRYGSIQPKSLQQDPGYSIVSRSEVVQQDLRSVSGNFNKVGNRSKSNNRNRSKRNIKKCEYNSKEELYEKELQNYDYVTNHVSQNLQNLKATNHNLLLDLNFQNKETQTRHSQMKRKSNQTMNYFPSNENRSMSVPWRNDSTSNYIYSKNELYVPKGKDFKVIRTTSMGVPQLLIISHPARRQSKVPKPGIDVIYKNSKYLACPAYRKAVIPPRENIRRISVNNRKYLASPKYVKSSIPHENYQRISVDSRKYSYNNNLQYNLHKFSKISAYFVNVPQKSQPNL